MYEFKLGDVMTAPKKVGGVTIKASLHQHEIFCKTEQGGWARVGFCGDKPSMPINLIRHFDDEFKNFVKAFVEKRVGKVKSVHQPPAPPPEPEEDEFDEYEDDETDEEE